MAPLGEGSPPIEAFVERNPNGGVHHVCYEVDDIIAARDKLKAQGARVLGTGEPKIGAHGKPVPVPAPQGLPRHPRGAGAGMSGLMRVFGRSTPATLAAVALLVARASSRSGWGCSS